MVGMTVVVAGSPPACPILAATDVHLATRPSREPAAPESSARWWLWAVAWGALDGPAGPGIALAPL